MAKIYYVGDWAVMCGPVFAETPFNYAYKGLELYNYGQWLKDALESGGTRLRLCQRGSFTNWGRASTSKHWLSTM
jgi:hypothetical protein